MIYRAGRAFRFVGSNAICGGPLGSALILLAPRLRKDIDASRSAVAVAGPDAVRLQCLHDLRMVRPFEVQGQLAAARGDRELGYRVLRILAGGAGQSLGQRGVYAGAAQDHAGSDHAGGVRRLLGPVSQGAAGVESPTGFFVYRYRCLLDLSQMVVIFRSRCRMAGSAKAIHAGARLDCFVLAMTAGGRGALHFAAGETRKIRPAELSVSSHIAPSGPCRTSRIRSFKFRSRCSSPITVLPLRDSRTSIRPASAPVNRLPVHFGNRFAV